MKLEDELRRALKPENPPDHFAERVAARIESARRRPGAMPARRRMIGMATAATIAMATGTTIYVAHRRQISEAERVRNDAVVGLRIASAKLNEVHERLLQRISSQNERSK